MNFYRHYKNKNYRYVGLVRHSETLEEMASYECLYDNDLGKLWVRPKDMFFGEIEIDGKLRPRFAKVEIPIEAKSRLLETERLQVEEMAFRLFPETWNNEKFRQKLLTRKNPLALLAREGHELVGFKLGYEQENGRFYSWLGGVHPAYRGLGLGRDLLRMQHQICVERGYREIETKTKNEYKSMLLLNLSEGFLVAGVEGADPEALKNPDAKESSR